VPTNRLRQFRQPAACEGNCDRATGGRARRHHLATSPRWALPTCIPRDDTSFRSAQETFATLGPSRQVFWLPDRPTGRAFPRLARSGSCGGRSRLQRRDRNGFAPFSLFFPRGDKPPEHLASGRNVAQPPGSSRCRISRAAKRSCDYVPSEARDTIQLGRLGDECMAVAELEQRLVAVKRELAELQQHVTNPAPSKA
jgi:hypothetical protein